MSEEIITVKNVTKTYRLYDKPVDRLKETFSHKQYGIEFHALSNVSFSVNKGETVGIIGQNGSGKSTILKILTGVLTQNEGEVIVDGKVSALLELGAGFNMEYSGIKNIYLNASIMNVSREEIEKKIPDIIAFADIGEHINQPVKTYSSGMFVRLAFAVAINVNPDILIVDEALAVGDTRFQLKCIDKFMEFKNAGKTILFVSHDINSIKRFCSRTIWLNAGKVIMDGDTDEVTDRYTDFLKSEQSMEQFLPSIQNARVKEVEDEIDINSIGKVDIAEIERVTIHNAEMKPINDVKHGQCVKVKVIYYVEDENIENPVLGIAIRSMDEEYICGLNTLLDKYRIPWKKGLNTMILTYDSFNLVGGSYYLDVAIFDSTATVPIQYKARELIFVVKMDYIAEGIVVMQHKWNSL